MKFSHIILGFSTFFDFSLQAMKQKQALRVLSIQLKKLIEQNKPITEIEAYIKMHPKSINAPTGIYMQITAHTKRVYVLYPIHIAISEQSLPLTKLLIDNGADVTSKTLLFHAILFSTEILEYLLTLKEKLILNIENQDRVEALNYANDPATLELLVKAGIDVNEKRHLDGNTVLRDKLIFAKEYPKKNLPFIPTLIALGARPDIMNHDQTMPIEEIINFPPQIQKELLPVFLGNCSLESCALICMAKHLSPNSIELFKEILPEELYTKLKKFKTLITVHDTLCAPRRKNNDYQPANHTNY